MYKYFLFIIICFVCIHCGANEVKEPAILIINLKDTAEEKEFLPRNFRYTLDPYKRESHEKLPSNLGLKNLQILGSAQFSKKNLATVLDYIKHPKTLYIVDLRQEWHGFLNGIPVSWYGIRNASNAGKSSRQIQEEEAKLLQDLAKKQDIVLSKIVEKDKLGKKLPEVASMPFNVKDFDAEQNLVKKLGLNYIRIPVVDALNPTPEVVDDFIDFVNHLPSDAYLYIHCAAGVGRTTTVMAMYDMMKNAKTVSFDDILERQFLLGGSDLKKLPAVISWKYPFAVQRYQFLKDFYQYAQTNNDNFKTSWSNYIKKNK